MDKKIIDTRNFQGEGLTMIVNYSNVKSPFLVVVTDNDTGNVLYYREYNKPQLTLNLPIHGEFVKLSNSGETKIKSVLLTKLKKPNYKYEFNKDLIVKRPYPIESVKVETLPAFVEKRGNEIVELKTPARFLPSVGKIQYSQRQVQNIPQPLKVFLGYHELGHYYYGRPYLTRTQINKLNFTPEVKQKLLNLFQKQMLEDEMEADRFALYKFLNDGYNFAGALYSLADNLPSDFINKERILNIHKEISKIHKINGL